MKARLLVLVIFVILLVGCIEPGCWVVTDSNGVEYEGIRYYYSEGCISLYDGMSTSDLVVYACGNVSVRPCK